MIPDPYALGTNGYKDIQEKLTQLRKIKWKDKRQKIYWRGSSTGTKSLNIANFTMNPRIKLCKECKTLGKVTDVKMTNIVQCQSQETRNKIREYLEGDQLLDTHQDVINFAMCKWIIDIDGNVNSWGLLWKLISGSCVIKVESNRKQWYYDKLNAYEDFIPVKSDLSDLNEQVEWCLANEKHCDEISKNSIDKGNEIIRTMAKDVLEAIKTY